MNATLKRDPVYVGEACFGVQTFTDDSGLTLILQTLEHVDCIIPVGVYTAARYDSPTKGQVWRLTNPSLGVFPDEQSVVPNGAYRVRTEILEHIGNTAPDSLGCILCGESRDAAGVTLGMPAVLSSGEAFRQLMEFTASWPDGWTLVIDWDRSPSVSA